MGARGETFAKKFETPLMVRSSFTDAEGTWIVPEAPWMRQVVVCGAAIVKDEARINVAGVPDKPGVSHRVFSAIADDISELTDKRNLWLGSTPAVNASTVVSELSLWVQDTWRISPRPPSPWWAS